MSMPNIPDITPDIKLKRKDVVNLLLASIAMEELGLAHLINAEGEKLQKVIKHARNMDDLLEANKSVEKMLKTIIKKEMLLQFKMEEVLEIPDEHKEHHHHHEEESSSSEESSSHEHHHHHHRKEESSSEESSDHKHHHKEHSENSDHHHESSTSNRKHKHKPHPPPLRSHIPPGKYKLIPRKKMGPSLM